MYSAIGIDKITMLMKQQVSAKDKIITSLLSGKMGKRYEGKQVILFDEKVYILPQDDQKSAKFVEGLIKQNPKSTPTVAFVPKKGSYILLTQL